MKWRSVNVEIDTIINEARKIRSELLHNEELARNIDVKREYIPVPKVGSGQIKLIIIGQDPTVKNEMSRDKVKTVLNLDKQNSLYRYLRDLADKLKYDIEENVYATNLLKCFYVVPPASIPNAVSQHTPYWIELLKAELQQYPNAIIITLGEPVLKALVTNGSEKVRDYWGYMGKKQADVTKFHYCDVGMNLLQRQLYPFPHQPSIRKEFYRETLNAYIGFVGSKL